jgi:hypothetical protein
MEEKCFITLIPDRIGRNKSKEQYAFFYKSDRFKVENSFTNRKVKGRIQPSLFTEKEEELDLDD